MRGIIKREKLGRLLSSVLVFVMVITMLPMNSAAIYGETTLNKGSSVVYDSTNEKWFLDGKEMSLHQKLSAGTKINGSNARVFVDDDFKDNIYVLENNVEIVEIGATILSVCSNHKDDGDYTCSSCKMHALNANSTWDAVKSKLIGDYKTLFIPEMNIYRFINVSNDRIMDTSDGYWINASPYKVRTTSGKIDVLCNCSREDHIISFTIENSRATKLKSGRYEWIYYPSSSLSYNGTNWTLNGKSLSLHDAIPVGTKLISKSNSVFVNKSAINNNDYLTSDAQVVDIDKDKIYICTNHNSVAYFNCSNCGYNNIEANSTFEEVKDELEGVYKGELNGKKSKITVSGGNIYLDGSRSPVCKVETATYYICVLCHVSGCDRSLFFTIKNSKATEVYYMDTTYTAASSYAISKGEELNGTFSVSDERAAEGDTVIVTPTPAHLYRVDKVTYSTASSTVNVAKNAEGKYAFTMPPSEVTVSVTFKEDDNHYQKVAGKATSCTVDGWKDYYKCNCNKYYTDSTYAHEIADLEAWKKADGKIEASGHETVLKNQKAATYFEIGYSGDSICKHCNQTIAKGKALAKLILKTPAFSKAKSNKKKKIDLAWSRIKDASGYEIQYTTDKRFKKSLKALKITKGSKLKATISKLTSNKKYYLRIRAYKTGKVKGKSKTAYSSWSKVKNVKVN